MDPWIYGYMDTWMDLLPLAPAQPHHAVSDLYRIHIVCAVHFQPHTQCVQCRCYKVRNLPSIREMVNIFWPLYPPWGLSPCPVSPSSWKNRFHACGVREQLLGERGIKALCRSRNSGLSSLGFKSRSESLCVPFS